ncbi:hypothetical protein ACFQRG_16935 [Scopulibacillus cellulosilyticus]|uniref:Wadjet protein JetD C-terminal domain-containing protein n=2 Tax=Scopulibacillus cellulosilyticus TaxID=2665665 RepID=A0ABW2Q220_9BACL
MSTLQNGTLFNSCNHSYRQKTEWSAFDIMGNYFVSTRKRWSECRICGKQNVLSPKERETYGILEFSGNIKDLLNEEEQLVAVYLLSELLKGNNNKRWEPLKKKLLQNYPYDIVDSAMETLHEHSLIIYKEEKVSLGWKIKQIKYNEKYLHDIRELVGWTPPDIPIWMSSPFPSLPLPKTTNGKKLHKLLIEQKQLFFQSNQAKIVDVVGNVIVSSSSSVKGYFKFIRILYALYENAEQHRKEYWKTFSQRVFGDTKSIQSNDKKRIQQYFGESLEEYGIIEERSEVVLSGEFTWVYEGHIGTSLAFKDYTAFPRDMINMIKVTSWVPPSMLIIENSALYFSIAKSKLLHKREWSIILGNGFISLQEMSIVYQACKLGLKEVFIWPDLDPYGLQIAQDICRKLNGQDVSVYLFGYTVEWFEQVGVYKPLESYDIDKIGNLLSQGFLHEKISTVLKRMREEGKKAEQEILFPQLSKSDFNQRLIRESIPFT